MRRNDKWWNEVMGLCFTLLLITTCRTFPKSQSPPVVLPNSFVGERVDTLALVGGKPITSEDFKNRFDLSLYPGEDYRDTTKFDFLYSLIAEKLLSEWGVKDPESMTPEEKSIQQEMEDVFLRDALYRSKVFPQTYPSGNELKQGMRFSTYSYFVDAFYFTDSLQAAGFYVPVTAGGENIYRLADSLGVSHDTLEISYGESTEEIEDAFFGHGNGFVSQPTITVDGWVVFRILSKKTDPKFAGKPQEDKAGLVTKVIQGRKEDELGRDYLMHVMKNVKVEVNYKIFRPLVYAIRQLISGHRPTSIDPYYYLSSADIESLRAKFSRELDSNLLTFDGGGMTLDRALDELPLAGFHSEDPSIPQITMGLHSALRFISQNYFLSKKAVELGLEKSGEVTYNVKMFLDAYRSSLVVTQVTDTVHVSQSDVDEFFEKHQDEVLNGVELKLKKFEAVGINDAVRIYDGLIGDKKSIKSDTSGNWTRASKLGEIGALIAQEPNGTVYGPLFENGKFIIYKLIDKRSGVTKEAIEHSIEVAKQMLLDQKKKETLDRYIADLAKRADVEIFPANVKSVGITPIEMLTFRYIGFGGKILAVPMLYPREGWIEYYKNERPPAP